MKTAFVVFGLALGASAAPARPTEYVREECTHFSISALGVEGTASEGNWGKIKQLSDGQIRIGQSNLETESMFSFSQSYGLYDENHFGCILAGPEEQLQCDSGKDSWSGWDIGFEGLLILQGSAQFWACATGDHDGFNIYKRPLDGVDFCYQVTLVADACHAIHIKDSSSPVPTPSCEASSCPSHSPVPTSSSEAFNCSSTSTKCSKCPGGLSGDWEFPHLIVPLDASRPDHAPGTSLFGIVSNSTRSYFNFDIPSHHAGKDCTVKFLFPEHWQLETSSFVLKGSGQIIAGWAREVMESSTYETAPEVLTAVHGTIKPGYSYVLGRGECRPGVMGFAMEGVSDTYFRWFQDFNPCPIGLYLVAE